MAHFTITGAGFTRIVRDFVLSEEPARAERLITRDDSLTFRGGVLPWLVPVGCNVYVTRGTNRSEQYVWLRVDSTGDGPERADVRWVGRREEYHDDLLREQRWETVFDCWGRCRNYIDTRWSDFLLCKGVAPGQLFLVCVCVSWSMDYWGEVDEDWDVEVVAKAPWGATEVLAAWEHERPFIPTLGRKYGYLPCPECGEDAIQASSVGCTDSDSDGRHADGRAGAPEPLWTEDDGGPCPGCGAELRVVVDDGQAYAEARDE